MDKPGCTDSTCSINEGSFRFCIVQTGPNTNVPAQWYAFKHNQKVEKEKEENPEKERKRKIDWNCICEPKKYIRCTRLSTSRLIVPTDVNPTQSDAVHSEFECLFFCEVQVALAHTGLGVLIHAVMLKDFPTKEWAAVYGTVPPPSVNST